MSLRTMNTSILVLLLRLCYANHANPVLTYILHPFTQRFYITMLNALSQLMQIYKSNSFVSAVVSTCRSALVPRPSAVAEAAAAAAAACRVACIVAARPGTHFSCLKLPPINTTTHFCTVFVHAVLYEIHDLVRITT